MLKKIDELKKDLEALDKERIKAEGALENAMKTLADLGFPTLEKAQQKLDELNATYAQTEKEVEELISTLKEKYADYID